MNGLVWACRVFLWLIVYSVIGWLYESTLCSITQRKLVNRGFLNGPLCPVYGFGALTVIAVFHDKSPGIVELFLSSAVLTTALEYVTSYLLEKLFHTRWWDYSHYRFQLNGRICLAGFLAFGALSVVLMKWVHPFVSGLIDRLPQTWLIGVSAILFVILAADCIVTVASILKLNQKLEEIQSLLDGFQKEAKIKLAEWKKDTNNKIVSSKEKMTHLKARLEVQLDDRRFPSERVRELLFRRKFQERRLLRAFPKMISTRYNDALQQLREKLQKKK